MDKIKFSDIRITGGLWRDKQDMVKNVTIDAVYNRFCETHRFEALKCTWKEGDPDCPHIFWDSDVAKWLESAAYIMATEERDEKLEKIFDDAVDLIVKNSDEHGYFNSHFLVTRQNERFCHRGEHELYCAGHLIEAAVAYYEATGKDKFLKAMCKYADYIEQVFKLEKSAEFFTPGHPELELALVRLYHATSDKRYLELSKYFIDEHGKPENGEISNNNYNQDDMPLRDRITADGHCVRALYLFCGMADIAYEYNDSGLLEACKRLFENITNRRMYITGGVGSTYMGESFTVDYDLPNRKAYAETCAAISLAMFAGRMQAIEPNSKYADIVEKVIYNGFLSGVSMDGKSFFYENPLEIDPGFNNKERFPITRRQEIFSCSCCPPNITRFIPSIAEYMYSYNDSVLYIHHYMNSETVGGSIGIVQETNYPADGEILIKCNIDKEYIALRIPGWCKSFKLSLPYEMKNGYAFVRLSGETEIRLTLDMPIEAIAANKRVHENAGRIAIMRGPVVYCAEGVDNGADLKNVRVDIHGNFELGSAEFLLPSIKTTGFRDADFDSLYKFADDAYEEFPLTLIPYYAFANRGTSEMLVWLLKK
ncbi:MAG: glycoside hydrolase family 127 protein [Clostridia bacterium]|nr:glycoside hydrolase family 127 protein [Clostridia bacterium]